MDAKNDSGVSVHTSKLDEAETSAVASSNPLVFQCAQCQSIVGDSTSWVSTCKTNRTLTLGRVSCKVALKPNIEVSQSGSDQGSTFQTVYCILCNDVLGKQYVASPPDLDYIRGCYTLQVEKLNSYVVGSGETTLTDLVNVPSPVVLMAKINKMQVLLVAMNDKIVSIIDRIKNLEGQGQGSDICLNQAETESVTSSENSSTRAGSVMTEELANMQRQMNMNSDLMVSRRLGSNNIVRPEVTVARQQNQQSNRASVQMDQNDNKRNNNGQNVFLRRSNSRYENEQDYSSANSHSGVNDMFQEKAQAGRRGIHEKDTNIGVDVQGTNRGPNPNTPKSTRTYHTNIRRSVSEIGIGEQYQRGDSIANVPAGNEGFKSPDRNESRGLTKNSSHNTSRMETWPSPGIKSPDRNESRNSSKNSSDRNESSGSTKNSTHNTSRMEMWPSPGIKSPDRNESRNSSKNSSHNSSRMETWPSPAVENQGRERKKRKMFENS